MGRSRAELNEWRRLHEAAIQVKEIAPWEFMEETDVFGVQNPETGELGFVSVMGLLGTLWDLWICQGGEDHAD